MKRSDARNEFLTGLLTTAIENGGMGFFYTNEYKWESVPLGEAFAVVEDKEDETKTYRIDLDVVAKGLGIIKAAAKQMPDNPSKYDNEPVLHSKDGKRLYMSPEMRQRIMLADRTNGEEGDLDAIDALAIVECSLFGAVTYA